MRAVEIWDRGFKYVDLRTAATTLHYNPQSIKYWIGQSKVRSIRYEGRRLVCLSDCYQLEAEKKKQKTVQQRIHEWAAANPQKASRVKTYSDLRRALAADGVPCSRTNATVWLTRKRGKFEGALNPKVVQWIEDDPARVYLEYREFSRAYGAPHGKTLTKTQVKRAKRRYWRRHPEPPFDLNEWCSTKEAAELLQVERVTAAYWFRQGRFGEVRRFKETHYVQRELVQQALTKETA